MVHSPMRFGAMDSSAGGGAPLRAALRSLRQRMRDSFLLAMPLIINKGEVKMILDQRLRETSFPTQNIDTSILEHWFKGHGCKSWNAQWGLDATCGALISVKRRGWVSGEARRGPGGG